MALPFYNMDYQIILKKYGPDIIKLRRLLHRFPELSTEEFETTRRIKEFLIKNGFSTEKSKVNGATLQIVKPLETGLVVRIKRGSSPRPVIAFRADIDALPVKEETGLDYASENHGLMHACGHDGHAAILALALLCFLEDRSWQGEVRGIFQPAEERDGGAQRMIENGAIDGVDMIFGLHIWPEVEEGLIASTQGTIMASNDRFKVTIEGKSTHGATPYLGVDPIVCACNLVMSLQTIISRELPPWEGGILTIGKIESGTSYNIIPSQAIVEGTIRTLSNKIRERIAKSLKRQVSSMADTYGCKSILEYVEQYPPTVNHKKALDFAVGHLPKALSYKNLTNPSMAAEDFACYLEEIPGVLFFLGSRNDRYQKPLHSSEFRFSEKLLEYGAEVFYNLGKAYLGSDSF